MPPHVVLCWTLLEAPLVWRLTLLEIPTYKAPEPSHILRYATFHALVSWTPLVVPLVWGLTMLLTTFVQPLMPLSTTAHLRSHMATQVQTPPFSCLTPLTIRLETLNSCSTSCHCCLRVGSHSGVKLCRWTKSMLRGRGGCYKHSFYGIESHRCMETTPSLACANKCVFCWRHHTNPGQPASAPCLPPAHLPLLCSSCSCFVKPLSSSFQSVSPGSLLGVL